MIDELHDLIALYERVASDKSSKAHMANDRQVRINHISYLKELMDSLFTGL